MFTLISVIFVICLEAVAIYFAYHAVVNSRTPQGSVAWVVFLIAVPYLAVLSYLFLGHKRFKGYVVARQKSVRVLDGLANAKRENPPNENGHERAYDVFEALAAAPVLSGNAIELLIDGQETFEAIFSAIEQAQSYVLVQFYIMRDDTLGRALRDILIRTAARGVNVRVLYDSVGSSRLPNRYVRELTNANVRILDSNALRGPTNRLQVNFRNHRKSVIVDGTIGFVGGHNVGDEYMGHDKDIGHWRDTHCLMRGPIVSQSQLIFCEDWHWATEETLLNDLNWQSGRAPENRDALLMASGPADEMETGNLYFCAAINAAKERIWIASPYFVPDADIYTALKVAALKGLDVRILMPESADHWATYLAAFDYFDELRQAGVQFWRYDRGFMHQKVLLIDEIIASIGTLNLDARSCRLNFEATVMAFDSETVQDVATMLKADFAQSYLLEEDLSEQPLWVRLGAPCARLFQPLL